MKLNEGVSGEGNALVDLRDLPAARGSPGAPGTGPAGRGDGLRAARPSRSARTWRSWRSAGGSSRSGSSASSCAAPRVQLRVLPDGDVELLSTHDQLLGGPSGQSYLGCRFPADYGYASAISRDALVIGRRLGSGGCPGPLRPRLRRRPRRRRCLDQLRHRDQPAQGRHDPPVPDAAVPHRRALRPRHGPLRDPCGQGEAPRRDRPPGGPRARAACPSTTSSTSSRAIGCTSTSRGRWGSCST